VRSLNEHLFAAFLTQGHIRYRKWLITQKELRLVSDLVPPKQVKMQVERCRKFSSGDAVCLCGDRRRCFKTQSVQLKSKIRGLDPSADNIWVEYSYALFFFFFLKSTIQSEGKIQAGRPENRDSTAGRRGAQIFLFFSSQRPDRSNFVTSLQRVHIVLFPSDCQSKIF
jgi:hypothetical protein